MLCSQELATLCPSVMRDPVVFNKVRTDHFDFLESVAPKDRKVCSGRRRSDNVVLVNAGHCMCEAIPAHDAAI